MTRNQNLQSIAWFHDLYRRKRLDLDPPYQRRSVWNQAFKDYFIDTVLLNYPAPAIFLYENISPEGEAKYAVVDGKQRLTAIFEFRDGVFPVYEKAQKTALHGLYWGDLDDETKRQFWAFQFSVEYLPSVDEAVLSSIFDRINRNTKRLSFQELRHAKLDGEFIREAERLAEWMSIRLGGNIPNIATSSRRQMKDVEFVADILLLLEAGPRGYSRDALDTAFSSRDDDWEQKDTVVTQFEETAKLIASVLDAAEAEAGKLRYTRLRNQADFYSLFGALAELREADGDVPPPAEIAVRLQSFATAVDDPDAREGNRSLNEYYEASRSASNDTAQRRTRIEMLKKVVLGDAEVS